MHWIRALLEHLMFLGTPRFGAEARERALLRMAADDNAWTWFDETVYHTVLPSASLEQVVMMEGDRFQHRRSRRMTCAERLVCMGSIEKQGELQLPHV